MHGVVNWPEELSSRLRDRNVVVTGGAGFIGSWLSAGLLESGASVTIIDDCVTGEESVPSALMERYEGRCRWVFGSILDPVALEDACEGADLVAHLGAVSNVGESLEDPARCTAVNTHGTFHVARAAQEAGATRLVFASSASVYGQTEGALSETRELRPMTPYAASKAAGEAIVSAWAQTMGLPGLSLRLFNIYGPGQRNTGEDGAVVAAFCAAAAAGKPAVIHGDGAQTRDFLHVRDAARAFAVALTGAAAPSGEAVNIGSGSATSIADLAGKIRGISAELGHETLDPQHAPARQGDPRSSIADTARMAASLGFTPEVGLEEGLKETLSSADGTAVGAAGAG